jgi:hypothetical protein
MRGPLLALAGVLAAHPLAAQEHLPPAASLADWSLLAAPPPPVEGRREGLSQPQGIALAGTAVAGDFTLETTLDYASVADGDVVGIALRGAEGGWISLQLEQITPALLIAVRDHRPGWIGAHGRLLATTAVSGWHDGRIRLKIERRGRLLRFAHAQVDGGWQALGPAIADPTSGAGTIGLFAVDGAER